MTAQAFTTQCPDTSQLPGSILNEFEEIFSTRFITMCNHTAMSKSQKESGPRLPPMDCLRIRGRWLNRVGVVGGRLLFEAVGHAHPPQRRRPVPRPMSEGNRTGGTR